MVFIITPEGKAFSMGDKAIYSCDPVRDGKLTTIGWKITAALSDGMYTISPEYTITDDGIPCDDLDEARGAAIYWLESLLLTLAEDTPHLVHCYPDGEIDAL